MGAQYKILADKILLMNIDGWGKRDVYYASVDELKTLLDAGAVLVNKDEPVNATINYTIKYKKQIFICSSVEKIKHSALPL